MDGELTQFIKQIMSSKKLPGLAATIIDATGSRLYHQAFGFNDNSIDTQSFTTSSPAMIWSCTKLVSSIAALQLLEQGKFALDDPVSKYLPEIAELGVIHETDAPKGDLQIQATKCEILVRHLFTHTSGLSHDYFNSTMLKWRLKSKSPVASNFKISNRAIFKVPLISQPGTEFHYGPSSEWLGFLIEAITGVPLHAYITKHILDPLQMRSTNATFDPDYPRLFVHTRGQSGFGPITADPSIQPLQDAEIRSAGSYLISTLDDFSQILLVMLNGGYHPPTKTRLLKTATVENYLFRDLLPKSCDRSEVGEFNFCLPHLSRRASLLHGVPRGWSCGMMINLEDVEGGRRKESGMWAGLGNVYYWIDPKGNRAGMVMTSLIPWLDPDVLSIFEALERVAYGGGTTGDRPLHVNY